jgi:peptidase A4-like protein
VRSARHLIALFAIALVGFGPGPGLAVARSHHRRGHHLRCSSRRRHHRHAKRKRCSRRSSRRPSGHGHTVAPASPASATAAANQSNNWSGYNQGTLEQGGTLFHSIGAQWTVPAATQHTSGQAESSSDWIGIGGGCIDASCVLTDPTLIQTGTEQDVGADGSASYSAWWEVIPGPSLTITSMAIHPGDRMSASIAEAAPNSEVWTITISDLSDGQSYATTVPYSSTHATAEWIQETPLVLGAGAGFAALPNLTMPQFDHATVNGSPANLKPSEQIQLMDSSGNVIAAPSSPDPDTDGFNVCTWASTCSAPTSS